MSYSSSYSHSLRDHSYTRGQFEKELSPLGYRYPSLSNKHDSHLWDLDNYVEDILNRSRAQTVVRDSRIDDIVHQNRVSRAMSEDYYQSKNCDFCSTINQYEDTVRPLWSEINSAADRVDSILQDTSKYDVEKSSQLLRSLRAQSEIRDREYASDAYSSMRRAQSEVREPMSWYNTDLPVKHRATSEVPQDPHYRYLSIGTQNSTPWSTTGGYYYPRYPESYRGSSSTYSPYLGRYNYYWESPSKYYRYSEHPFKYGYPTYPTRYASSSRYQSSVPKRYAYYPRYQSRFYR